MYPCSKSILYQRYLVKKFMFVFSVSSGKRKDAFIIWLLFISINSCTTHFPNFSKVYYSWLTAQTIKCLNKMKNDCADCIRVSDLEFELSEPSSNSLHSLLRKYRWERHNHLFSTVGWVIGQTQSFSLDWQLV